MSPLSRSLVVKAIEGAHDLFDEGERFAPIQVLVARPSPPFVLGALAGVGDLDFKPVLTRALTGIGQVASLLLPNRRSHRRTARAARPVDCEVREPYFLGQGRSGSTSLRSVSGRDGDGGLVGCGGEGAGFGGVFLLCVICHPPRGRRIDPLAVRARPPPRSDA